MKLFYSYDNLVKDLHTIIRDMTLESYQPDVIIGPGRGGYFVGVMLSHYYGVPFKGFNWQTRDGIVGHNDVEYLRSIIDEHEQQSILLVDDINDTGKTLQGIDDEIFSHALNNSNRVIYDLDVKCATLFNKTSSSYDDVQYYAHELTPDNDQWIVFPYEEWWK